MFKLNTAVCHFSNLSERLWQGWQVRSLMIKQRRASHCSLFSCQASTDWWTTPLSLPTTADLGRPRPNTAPTGQRSYIILAFDTRGMLSYFSIWRITVSWEVYTPDWALSVSCWRLYNRGCCLGGTCPDPRWTLASSTEVLWKLCFVTLLMGGRLVMALLVIFLAVVGREPKNRQPVNRRVHNKLREPVNRKVQSKLFQNSI